MYLLYSLKENILERIRLTLYINQFKLASMGNLCSWNEDERSTETASGPAIVKQPQENVKHCNDDLDRTS